ncbi:MAG: sigma-54 dependent transcriptional regulator [bacterium]
MKQKILLIDDEESIRFSFKIHLSKEGYQVMTAENYPSAIKIISESNFDLIITDIILDGYAGINILKEVKKRGMHCPVIMITGEPNLKTAAAAVRLGAFDYIPKPVRKETLLRATNLALRHKALQDEKNKIEMEKERYRNNLKAIFKSIKDVIITVDNDMRVIEANEATKGICGFSPGQIKGKQFSDIVSKCNKSCLHVMKETLKKRRTIKEAHIECKHKDRPNQVALLTSSPLIAQNKDFTGAVIVVRDITRLTDLEQELNERNRYDCIIGKSEKMQEIYQLINHLTEMEATVLITGENGTGKELVARALHNKGPRSSKPMVSLNCSALAENLLESELFGHVKGAFTGAVKNKIGRFQLADGGTLFLDEIGDISPIIQLKLLRVLQEKKFEQVGDSAPISVDIRIIAATNQDLKEKIRLGKFRQDLYYRLKVVEINLPPLRERREDIPLLTNHFIDIFNKKFKKNIAGISDSVLSLFMHYSWPGNIRELEHTIEHAFVLCHDRTITIDKIPAEIKKGARAKTYGSEKDFIDEPQKVLWALNNTDWNKAKAARLLGISRPSIYHKIKEFKLIREQG